DLIVRVGPAPSSSTVCAFLTGLADVPQVVIDDGDRWRDHLGRATRVISGHPGRVLHAVSAAAVRAVGGGEAGGASAARAAWRGRWRTASEAAGEALTPLLTGEDAAFEGGAAAAVVDAVPDGGVLFIGNSMPIRDVDAFAAPRDREIRALGLRGASGIDGNVSATLGAAAASGAPTVALIGDLTLLHDVGALITAAAPRAPVQIVVVQNRGGGIFHMLPIRDFDPPFTDHVVMPHDVEIAAVAGAARIPHRLTASIGELRAELAAGWDNGGLRVLEIPFDREENRERRRAAIEKAGAAALDRLGAG
ncbi:MAG: thiamine pyrophosphate-dependent enzyme, partial [Gemmatimonadota bacterium]|nr:thiamine pyrophosphate-dependent enzyme [Gemmatimonadota bacterium]